jgi:glycosyltransferase involved in cell wall biosynthesis
MAVAGQSQVSSKRNGLVSPVKSPQSSTMDIALIIHELLVEGGGERLCVCLAEALSKHGHKVVLYTTAYDEANCFPEICKAFTIKVIGRGRFPSLRRPLFIRGYLDMLRLAASVEEKHEIWNPHHWPAQWGAVWLKRKLGGSVVWNCNDVPDFHEKAFHRQSIKGAVLALLYWLYYLYDRRQNRKVDLVLLLSVWAESEYRAIYSGRTHVVRSGMDPARFAPSVDRTRIRDRFGYSNDEFVLLWLGIFMPHRRLEDAINALGHLVSHGIEVKLLLAGSDRAYPVYVASLKALARNLGVQDKVTFAAKVAEEEIRDFYCSADAFVFPNDQQTWGLAVLEAMACGCPVLVSRGSGVHEVLTDQDNALLFSPRNPEELAKKIEVLVSHAGLRREIARRGMELARGTYNWDRFTEQIETSCRGFVEHKDSSVFSHAPVVTHPAEES